MVSRAVKGYFRTAMLLHSIALLNIGCPNGL